MLFSPVWSCCNAVHSSEASIRRHFKIENVLTGIILEAWFDFQDIKWASFLQEREVKVRSERKRGVKVSWENIEKMENTENMKRWKISSRLPKILYLWLKTFFLAIRWLKTLFFYGFYPDGLKNHNICTWRTWSLVSSNWENIKRNVGPCLWVGWCDCELQLKDIQDTGRAIGKVFLAVSLFKHFPQNVFRKHWQNP